MPETIAEVIDRLTEIVDTSAAQGSRLGYFAALYRKVTIKVRDEIDAGYFEDNERMERLDVVFANRYLSALEAYRRGDLQTRSWAMAFDSTKHWWPIVLQHLLLGINAHINFDLGIAAAEVCPGDSIQSLRTDFNRINLILAGLLSVVKDELAEIWPLLALLDRIGGKTDDALINFSMQRARDHAWRSAEELAVLSDAERDRYHEQLDERVTRIAKAVRNPGWLLGTVTRLIKLGELGGVGRKIGILR